MGAIKYLVFLLLLIPTAGWTTTYYADNSLGGNCAGGAGTSYSVAARDCSASDGTIAYTTIQGAINGINLEPLDILEVRAGTYTESITPAAADSGSADGVVTLRARSGETVVISGGGTLLYGINLTNVDYFTVDGFTVEAFRYTHILTTGTTKTNVTVKNCTINITCSLATTQSIHGILIAGTNMVVEGNTITQNASSSGTNQADLITGGNSAQYIISPIVRNNILTLANTSPEAYVHSDNIQLTNAKDAQVYNNICYRPTTSPGQGMLLEFYNTHADPPEDFGNLLVYNNLIYGYGSSYLLNIYPRATSTYTKATVTVYVYNNTIDAYNLSTSLPFYTTAPDIYFKNNLIIARRTNSPTYLFTSSAAQTTTRINYNMYYAPSKAGDVYSQGGTSYSTFTAWKTAGFDNNSVVGTSTDPSVSETYTPNEGSPVINVGVDLSAVFTTDITGATRSGSWDIGAYEYDGGGEVPSHTVTVSSTGDGCSLSANGEYEILTGESLNVVLTINNGWKASGDGWGGTCPATGTTTRVATPTDDCTVSYTCTEITLFP